MKIFAAFFVVLISSIALGSSIEFKTFKEYMDQKVQKEGVGYAKGNCVDTRILKLVEGTFQESTFKQSYWAKYSYMNGGMTQVSEEKFIDDAVKSKSLTVVNYSFIDENTRLQKTSSSTMVQFSPGDIQSFSNKRERLSKLVNGVIEVVSTRRNDEDVKEGDDWVRISGTVGEEKSVYVESYRQVKNFAKDVVSFHTICVEEEIGQAEYEAVVLF